MADPVPINEEFLASHQKMSGAMDRAAAAEAALAQVQSQLLTPELLCSARVHLQLMLQLIGCYPNITGGQADASYNKAGDLVDKLRARYPAWFAPDPAPPAA